MLNSSLTINFDGTAYTLNRVHESNYSSEYFYRAPTLDLLLQVGHTLPKNGKGEAHVVTLTGNFYDAEGVLVRTERVYTRFITPTGKQATTSVVNLEAALRDFMATNATAIADRES